MPNQPKVPNNNRVIRVDLELWTAAKAKAEQRGESLAEAIRRFLQHYIRR